MVASLPMGARAQRAAPNVQPEGLTQAQGFMDRMVRITARRPLGGADTGGVSGYGFIVGEHPTSGGETGFIVVTADHLVRDPAQPEARFEPPKVTYYANLAVTVTAELLPQRLPPNQGDLAVLVIPRDVTWHMGSNFMGDPGGMQPGTAAWQVGKAGSWSLDKVPGHFAGRDSAGWLTFDGLDTPTGSAGAAVVINRGLIGMVTEDGAPATAPTRALAVDLMAESLRAWNLEWDIGARDVLAPKLPGTGSSTASLARIAQPALPGLGVLGSGSMPAPIDTPAAPNARLARPLGLQGGQQTAAARPAPALNLPPIQIIPLLPAEVAARTSWVPPGARVSPWPQVSASLLSAPRREATPVGTMPAGSVLPQILWVNGAYEIVRKLDNGAWFLVASEGQQIGYVAGGDVIEVWPALKADAPPSGRPLREWTTPGGARVALRDATTAYDMSVSLKCGQAYCDSVQIYTPRPPAAGALVPTFQVRTINGSWHQDDVAAVRIQVPRQVVDTKGVQLMACVGRGTDCREERLLPPG